ncbi:Non-canonical non-ribosomal peptide synthetase ascB like protein [Verticillium longisporum]|nr:Non-canonical non-ribosomal peptide synthetase ascB like protein [Verticillium longisporum]
MEDHRPIALYMESDVGLFIYLAALTELKIPLLLISARLGPLSVAHLLRETGASFILVTRRTKLMLQESALGGVGMTEVLHWQEFLHETIPDGSLDFDGKRLQQTTSPTAESPLHLGSRLSTNGTDSGTNVGALILHSSGTTGLPKPIYLAPRYILGYAACHEISENEVCSRSLSTLPMYHGFGLLAPCLSLSIGMTCCFPPASVIPAGRSTVDLLQLFKAEALLTVPSIVEDLLSLPDDEKIVAVNSLKALSFVAVGGGALRPDLGTHLVENKIKLVNHYGVTEIGAIAPIFHPGPDYDHRYLRLREDLGLHLQPIKGSERFKLIGYPVGWHTPFEVQDELERNQDNPSRIEVRIIGRMDDVIVLKSGEKVMPRLVETSLMADPQIQTAVCVGSGAFEIIVIVEPSSSVQVNDFKRHVWDLVKSLNETLDQHARISSINAIIVKPPGKSIPRSDKGSVMRREVADLFREEIEAAYAELDNEVTAGDTITDTSDMVTSVQKMVRAVATNLFSESLLDFGEEDDLFERGMDSLQCVRLARLLNSALSEKYASREAKSRQLVTKEFVYANPSIRRLAQAVTQLLSQQGENTGGSTESQDTPGPDSRLRNIRALLGDCVRDIRAQTMPRTPKTTFTVAITGATGNLGANVVAQLASNPLVKKTICLVREGNSGQGTPEQRVRTALGAAGLSLSPQQWEKVEFEQCDPGHWVKGTNCFQDTQSSFSRIADQVSHIIHLAWPMDFHRTLESFRPQLRATQGLIQLARAARLRGAGAATGRVRLVFASSIAVVRGYSDAQGSVYGRSATGAVPEMGVYDPRIATPMGYAEAKWVCEQMLAQVSQELRDEVEPVVVRIGQLSGPESGEGVWKTAEHIPALVKASQIVGGLPALEGTASWLPVDRAAKSLSEIALHAADVPLFLHLENPVRQPLADICAFFAAELGLPTRTIPFEEWMQQSCDAGALRSLEGFFRDHFQALASGSVVLDTARALAVSETLRGSGGVPQQLIAKYVARWRKQGFLE